MQHLGASSWQSLQQNTGMPAHAARQFQPCRFESVQKLNCVLMSEQSSMFSSILNNQAAIAADAVRHINKEERSAQESIVNSCTVHVKEMHGEMLTLVTNTELTPTKPALSYLLPVYHHCNMPLCTCSSKMR